MSASLKPLAAPAPTVKVSVLGATGTIGDNTLKIIDAHPGRYTLGAISAAENVDALIALAHRYRPEIAVIANPAHYETLRSALVGSGVEAAAGADAVAEAAARPSDVLVSAIVGAAALVPTLAAIRRGGRVALANKECLVCAGPLVMREVERHGATLIPVDSEHSAIFQVLDMRQAAHVRTVTITASGGPFREWSLERMANATPAEAVRHPNWNMGTKISVDSATLMNKGLELLEAHYLFPLAAEQLRVLVHPQSVVHCLVTMQDGSVLSQMSPPDMRIPIACALAWPERIAVPLAPLDLAAIGQLTFEHPDEVRFPALSLARRAMLSGGSMPATLNAANEVAVQRFLRGDIGFLDISRKVEAAMEKLPPTPIHSIDDVLACDHMARQITESL